MQGQAEFEKVYLQFSDRIFRFLFWRLRDASLAEDLTSEVFTKAWVKWNKFDGEHPQAWLYQIARNLLVDSYRQKKTTQTLEEMELSYDQELLSKIEKDEDVGKLQDALVKLPDNLKEVVILRFIEGESSAEVAKALGTTEGNIRVLQHRAILRLRELLKNG